MARKANKELDHEHSHRFDNALDLHRRYTDLVESNDNRKRHANFIRAYKRYPYPLRNGKQEPNFGQFEFLINSEVDRYVDIITERKEWYSIEVLEAPDEKKEAEWGRAISKYFHKYCIKPWEDAHENSFLDVFKMKMFGVGIEHWDNQIDLYPEHVDNHEFTPDSNAGMNPKTWDMAFRRKKWTAVELYNEVKAKGAKANGWNRVAVMQAIKKACGDEFEGVASKEIFSRFTKGEVDSVTGDTEISLVYAYVREYDSENGKQISRYVFTESGEIVEGQDNTESGAPSVKNFLRFQPRLYSEFSNAVSLRADNITESYHDMASFGETIYIYCRFYDKAMNKIIRQGIRKGNVYLNSSNPDDQRRLSEMDHEEEFQVLPPETSIIETNLRAGDSKTLAEAVRQLKIDTQSGSGGGLVTGSQNVKGRAITAKEAEIQLTETSAQSITKHKVFASNDSSLGRELFRRFIEAVAPNTPEAKNQKRFLNKMEELEIPKESYKPENVIVTSVINPSAANPQSKLTSAKTIVGALHVYSTASTEGERRAAQEMIAAVAGWHMVPYYLPEEDSKFEEDQLYLAGRENSDLDDPFVNPKNVQVRSDDVHPIHITFHIEDMSFKLDIAEKILQSLDGMPNQARIVQLGKAADILNAQDNKGAHVEAHMQMLSTAAQTTKDPNNIVKLAQHKLQEVRKREAELEQRVAKLYEEANQGQDSVNNLELEHRKAMNQQALQHEASMMQLALKERMSKTQANAEGAKVNQNQKLIHKEQDQAQKVRQTAIDNAQKTNGDRK